jgi:hypothetical protein
MEIPADENSSAGPRPAGVPASLAERLSIQRTGDNPTTRCARVSSGDLLLLRGA